MDYKLIINEIAEEIRQIEDEGTVATYIPELAKISPLKFGVHFTTIKGKDYGVGDNLEKFSIQSISKVLTLTMAFNLEGDNLWKRVGVEPSGNSFNSLIQLEYEKGIPRNPLINAGAIVICDVLISKLENPKKQFLDFVRKIATNDTINYNKQVAASEKETGFRNSALINLMKSFGNIENNIEDVLKLYYDICSIEMSCKELSTTFLLFANNGVIPSTNEKILTRSYTKRINAIMQLCGFYDEAGEFSFKVGLPGKSGVGGGIVAIHPTKYSVAVWSPKLNKKGNSFKGIKALELLTTKSELSIF
jgi:glutaminase